jgi:hypothetical protein
LNFEELKNAIGFGENALICCYSFANSATFTTGLFFEKKLFEFFQRCRKYL